MSWLNEFPSLGSEQLSAMRRAIDGTFRGFTREYGEPLERCLTRCAISCCSPSACSRRRPGRLWSA